mmetsp:Transcript_31138/g.57954  ORF Transcript_31138/g.57954 Transcript_31138/m.57954 type:complete len:741 (-) Transcript_31138:1060-3282(-)
MKRSHHQIVNMFDMEEEEHHFARLKAPATPTPTAAVYVMEDSPTERAGVPVTPVVGRRAKRKFCASCVDYFCKHYNHLFPQPLHPEFVRLQIQNYLDSLSSDAPVDYSHSNTAEVERIAAHCVASLQDKYGAVASHENDAHGVGQESEELEDVEFIAQPSSSSASSSAPRPVAGTRPAPLFENSASGIINEVLKIYPDAAPAFITALLDTHSSAIDLVSLDDDDANPQSAFSPNTFLKIVTEMSENGYDKVERKRPAGAQSSSSSSDGGGARVGNRIYSHDFASTSWPTSAVYRSHAVMLLQNDFPYLKVQSLQQFFAGQGKHHYSPTLQALEALGIPRQKDYPISAAAIRQGKQTLQGCAAALTTAKLKLKQTWKATPFLFDFGLGGVSLDEVLQEECHYLHALEVVQQEARDHEVAKQLNEELAEHEGALLECGCCCGEYAFEALIQCSEGHLFCRTCLKSYIENTLFGSGKTRLACMSSAAGEPCPGTYSERFVETALPPLVYQKYQDAVAQEAVKAANIEGLLQCHACGYQAELSSDAGSVLTCPSCAQQTCRYCQEEAHIPLRCSEVEKKAVTNVRVNVEEAMSEARIRICPNPKCKQRFYKTEGCNKMSCSCGKKICYQCRKDITKEGYKHFCNTPHCDHKKCGNCLLFSDSVADDRQAMYEAGVKKMEEEKKSLPPPESSGVTASGIGGGSSSGQAPEDLEAAVNLDSLLEGGALKPKKKARNRPPAMRAPRR